MLLPRDFLGNEISIGSIIVYPVRKASSMWMVKARVTGIRREVDRWDREFCTIDVTRTQRNIGGGFTGPRSTKFYSPERCVVVSDGRPSWAR